MAPITLNHQPVKDATVLKIRPDNVPAAIQAATKDGADDVFVKDGKDTLAIAARHLPLECLIPGKAIEFQGHDVTVLAVDPEISSASKTAMITGGVVGAAGGAIAGGVAGTLGSLCLGMAEAYAGGGVGAGWGKGIGGTAIVGAVIAGSAGALIGKWVSSPKLNLEQLKQYAE